MKTVELVVGIKSSVLGFGCAPILGSVDAGRAKRALDCAFDYGITHYDLARSYGYGEAEEFVGKLLKDRRSQVVLATKFGIQANWKASLFKPLKPIVRLFRDTRRKENFIINGGINTVADRFHDRVPFRSLYMRKSLEKSLQALRTDYIDYFFLHEPQESLYYIDELVETANILKDEGKIRAWGIAYMRSQQTIHKSYISKFDLLQFDNSFGSNGYNDTIMERGLKPNVLFSPLRGGSIEIRPKEKLEKLSVDFPNSVLLCSMFNEKHIKENISLFK